MNIEELYFFYQKTGEAIWHLQYVEDALVKLYMIKAIILEPGNMDDTAINSEMDKLNKKTLGQLIGLAENSSIVSEEVLSRLKEFNGIRKWVVHNSNRESRESLYTDSGRSAFMYKIQNFIDMSVELHSKLKEALIQYGRDCGIDEAPVIAATQEHMQKLRGEA